MVTSLEVFLNIVFFVATCSALTRPENGAVTYDMSPINDGYPVGTKATYSCHRLDGYHLFGAAIVTCETNGVITSWNAARPICECRKMNR